MLVLTQDGDGPSRYRARTRMRNKGTRSDRAMRQSGRQFHCLSASPNQLFHDLDTQVRPGINPQFKRRICHVLRLSHFQAVRP
jgi:hypothetical protein